MTSLSEVIAASPARARVTTLQRAPGCVSLFAFGAAALQMAGYSTKFKSIAAGRRPVLVPRRVLRAEQTIRSEGLRVPGADIVGASALDEVCELVRRPRLPRPDAAERAPRTVLDPENRPRPQRSLARDATT